MIDRTKIRRLRQRLRGQGMTEYIVIVGLIALLLIGAVQYYAGAVDEAIVGTEKSMRNNAVTPMRNVANGTAPGTAPGTPSAGSVAGTYTPPGGGTPREVLHDGSGGMTFRDTGAALTPAQAANVR